MGIPKTVYFCDICWSKVCATGGVYNSSGSQKPCFLTNFGQLLQEKNNIFIQKNLLFQNFRKFFVIFGITINVQTVERFSPKYIFFFEENCQKSEKYLFCSSYFNQFFEKFSSFCVKKHEKLDFSKFGEGGYLGHTIHRKFSSGGHKFLCLSCQDVPSSPHNLVPGRTCTCIVHDCTYEY